MSIEQIKSDLSQAMYYPNEQGKAFTPYERVKRIWKGNSLKLFLESMGGDQHMSPLQIKEAKDGLLRTISVLVNIVPKNWEGWSRFQAIFFPLDEATAHWRRDKNATSFTKEELADDSFLGDLNMARSFSDDVWIYFPVILNEKREEESKYDSPLRVPLFQIGSEVRPGGYGNVTKELIPPNHIILRHSSDHLGIPETRHPAELIVARKRFHRPNHYVEVKLLEHLRSVLSSHKRIVCDIARFSIGNELNIIMPWAEMDLEYFLSSGYREMQSTEDFLNDLIRESKQLASALSFLHTLKIGSDWSNFHTQAICHADLKPKNILVFKRNGSSTGLWRITDFGVSKLVHRYFSGSGRDDSGYPTSEVHVPPPRGGAYQAPDPHTRRRSDVWSFGCILVRIFALGLDAASLPILDEKRNQPVGHGSSDCFHQGTPPVLNQSIESWIRELATKYRDSQSSMFLKEMQNLLSSMLKIDYRQRPNASKVETWLHTLYLHRNDLSLDSPVPIVVIAPSPSGSSNNSTNANTVDDEQSQGGSSTGTTDHGTTSKEDSVSTNTTESPPRPRLGSSVGVLVSVIKSGDIDQVRLVLKEEIDVEDSFHDERPLIHAIESNNAAAIEELSNFQRRLHIRNLDVRTPSSVGETPLSLAISNGNVDVVKAVVDADTDPDPKAGVNTLVNETLPNEKTPLMEAAFLGHAAVVTFLLDRGADHKIWKGEEKLNCLHYALILGNRAQEDVIKAFVRRIIFDQVPPGHPPGDPYETPLMLHIRSTLKDHHCVQKIDSLWLKKFKMLLEGGANIHEKNPFGMNSLQLAVRQENSLLAKVLFDAGARLPIGCTVPPKASREMRKILKGKK